MLDIKSLASGSTGNCYKVSDGKTSLLIEAGIPIKKIKQGLNYRLSEIEGVLVSHEHGDHSKAIKDVVKAGINCYMSKGTIEAVGINNHRIIPVKTSKAFKIGTWVGKGFNVEHDAKEPYGFLLWSKNTGDKLVYLTDTYYTRYKFHQLDYIMVECNYAIDILNKNVEAGLVHQTMKNRVIKSHFGLENVKDFLKSNDLSKTQEIWLLHLSDMNSHAERFKREIQELTGKLVYIA